MQVLKNLNLLLKFLLELAMLAAFGYWGFSANHAITIQIAAGLGIPLAVALLWGLLMAPRAKRRLKGFAFHALELVLFGFATLALWSTGQVEIALVFAGLYLINKVLGLIWKQGSVF